MTLQRSDAQTSSNPNDGAQSSGPTGDDTAVSEQQYKRAAHIRSGSTIIPRGASFRIAVVGCGYWGSKHVRVLSSISDVASIMLVDPNVALVRSLQDAFPAAAACSNLEAALPQVDAVVIATPPQSHARLALAALRAGKHVLVEKPLTTRLEDAEELIEESRRAGTVLMVGHTFQFNPAIRELRRRVRVGDLGTICYVRSERLNLGPYRPDVNVVWDLAPHDVSILNFLLDDAPKAVDAWGASLAFDGIKDMAHIRLEYEKAKVTGYAHVSWLDPRKTRTVTVVGSEKMAVYDDLAEEPLRIFDRGVHSSDTSPSFDDQPTLYRYGGAAIAPQIRPSEPPAPQERDFQYRYGDIIAPHIRPGEPLAIQDRHFIDCLQKGTVPEASGEDALKIVATLEAVDRLLNRHRSLMPVFRPPEAELCATARRPLDERSPRHVITEMRS